MDLVASVYDVSRNFPSDEQFALTTQIRKACVSVCSNIAEGHGRGTKREFAMFLRNANGSLKEVETQLLVAKRLRYLNEETWYKLSPIVDDVGRMLHGLIEYQTKRLDGASTLQSAGAKK